MAVRRGRIGGRRRTLFDPPANNASVTITSPFAPSLCLPSSGLASQRSGHRRLVARRHDDGFKKWAPAIFKSARAVPIACPARTQAFLTFARCGAPRNPTVRRNLVACSRNKAAEGVVPHTALILLLFFGRLFVVCLNPKRAEAGLQRRRPQPEEVRGTAGTLDSPLRTFECGDDVRPLAPPPFVLSNDRCGRKVHGSIWRSRRRPAFPYGVHQLKACTKARPVSAWPEMPVGNPR